MTDESEWEDRQQMGVSDNTHRSQQQRPRSPLHCWGEGRGIRGVMGKKGRKRWLGCWSAKIKRDPIIGITTSQWAGKLSYLENTEAFACTLERIPQAKHTHTQRHTHKIKKRRSNMHRCYKSAHIHTHKFLLYSFLQRNTHSCTFCFVGPHAHTLLPKPSVDPDN